MAQLGQTRPRTQHRHPDRNHDPTDQATELERRARKLLDTSTPLKNRQPDDGERLRWLPHVTRLLAQGTDAARIVELLCQAIDRGELDEAA